MGVRVKWLCGPKPAAGGESAYRQAINTSAVCLNMARYTMGVQWILFVSAAVVVGVVAWSARTVAAPAGGGEFLPAGE